MKESEARMEKIPSTMVLHKYVDGADTRFFSGPLANNPLGEWLGVIRIGTYQAVSEDSRWAYEPMSNLWEDIEPDIDSRNFGSSDYRSKYQENPDDQE